MSNEIGILFNKTQRAAKELMRSEGLTHKEMEYITGQDREWIRKFIANEINDPGSKRLESFAHEIKKYNAAKRKGK